ncbi:hypothetical protein LTR85_002116 [Meristemomyces frigidus]|nr:hypothetical protein LTR85_002116 [Meristemomyces frigidus]
MRFFLAATLLAASVSALAPGILEERKTDGQAIAELAHKQIGIPYVYGGGNCKGPTTGISPGGPVGFDCSGLNLYTACKVLGSKDELPHHAQTQYTDYKEYSGIRVDYKDAKPGDFYHYTTNSNGNCGSGVEHTNIKYSTGHVINAPKPNYNVLEEAFWTHSGGLTICSYAIRFW